MTLCDNWSIMINTSKSLLKFSCEDRRKKANALMDRDPDRVPILLTSENNDWDLPVLFLLKKLTAAEMLKIIRSKLKLNSSSSLVLFCNGKVIQLGRQLEDLMKEGVQEDHFLHVRVNDVLSAGSGLIGFD